MNPYYIYTLTNPKNNKVFYVGQTINPEDRKKVHQKCYLSHKVEHYHSANEAYIKFHRILPVFEIIEVVNSVNRFEAEKIEQYWIFQFNEWGFELQNRMPFEKLHDYKIEKFLPYCGKSRKKIMEMYFNSIDPVFIKQSA